MQKQVKKLKINKKIVATLNQEEMSSMNGGFKSYVSYVQQCGSPSNGCTTCLYTCSCSIRTVGIC